MTGSSLIKRPEHSLTIQGEVVDIDDERAPSLRNLVLAGVAAIGVGFGGFGAWAVTARLDNAAVASGIVAVDSKRKTVSHLEGGILQTLLKAEGERVAPNEPLGGSPAAAVQQAVGGPVGGESGPVGGGGGGGSIAGGGGAPIDAGSTITDGDQVDPSAPRT